MKIEREIGHPLILQCESSAEAEMMKAIFLPTLDAIKDNEVKKIPQQKFPEISTLSPEGWVEIFCHNPAQLHFVGQVAFSLYKAVAKTSPKMAEILGDRKEIVQCFFFDISQGLGDALHELAPGFLEDQGGGVRAMENIFED